MTKHIKLGINVDHVATLRQARQTVYPEPLQAALIAQEAGADSITIHLREDRRHIQEHDVLDIMQHLEIPLNLEMAITEEMLSFAEKIKPTYCCLVPEKRQELTTEGGLDVVSLVNNASEACQRLVNAGIKVSFFIDPDIQQIEVSRSAGADIIELHTGTYADTVNSIQDAELERIRNGAVYAKELGLQVNAGHGLTVDNVKPIVAITEIEELNIGHSIISRAVFIGLEHAVKEMKKIMNQTRQD